MPIDDKARQKIIDHLQGRNHQCPLCGTNKWSICDDLFSPVFIDLEHKKPVEDKILPIVALMCDECGNIRQIAAGKIGLLS